MTMISILHDMGKGIDMAFGIPKPPSWDDGLVELCLLERTM